jgi:hypothetical protein
MAMASSQSIDPRQGPDDITEPVVKRPGPRLKQPLPVPVKRQELLHSEVRPWVVVATVLALLSLMLFIAITSIRNRPGSGKYQVWRDAKQYVEAKLLYPSTADFDDGPFGQDTDKLVKDCGNGEYEVTGRVDTQNSFGAKVRRFFRVKLRYDGRGNVTLVSISLV